MDNKNNSYKIYISKSKIKVFIICFGLSFFAHLLSSFVYGDFKVKIDELSLFRKQELRYEKCRRTTFYVEICEKPEWTLSKSYVKKITFNPLYGEKYSRSFSDEKFIYKDYVLKSKKWNTIKKVEYIVMCSLINLHLIVLSGCILFVLFFGAKFLINNFQIKLKA